MVCGIATKWWEEHIKNRINSRQEVYKMDINGHKDL